ncbi:hydrogenase expression/formation protein HypE [Helicobacter sp. CLO-3]|uniref:hydrogenase expression/formation protein HypE n=1 Tax=unclassified Helicobacter TaxID=2593540 RepID=UPI000805D737|nr:MULTISPECIES: hydrogenase expression/formation protein HypE [unclassified Helicobacter]OBV28857.1 hydrogenase expression/formation protein HypE [Helicobacter sp. CLO-3]OHU81492.1 hydrogenase expression/formation protein HypE [Helicobacter sp. CLO-3]
MQLAQGSGGAATNALIDRVFLKHLGRFFVSSGEDAGVFGASGDMALSTDSFVISPIFFQGGDIGKLSVCGSSNDVAMMGAKPQFMSFGFIIEEGLPLAKLESIVQSIALELQKTGIKILSADTKVVPRGGADKVFINTTCLGHITKRGISAKALQKGDAIILSAPIGAHGASIFATREGIGLDSSLQSDCAQLYPMLEPLLASALPIHAMRDATRGGLSAVLNEWAQDSRALIEVDEEALIVDERVQGVCEILGLEAYMLANEGVCVIAAPSEAADEICAILRAHPLGAQARIIGRVAESAKVDSSVAGVLDSGAAGDKRARGARVVSQNLARVVLKSAWGGKRFMEYPQGELLPRIC